MVRHSKEDLVDLFYWFDSISKRKKSVALITQHFCLHSFFVNIFLFSDTFRYEAHEYLGSDEPFRLNNPVSEVENSQLKFKGNLIAFLDICFKEYPRCAECT